MKITNSIVKEFEIEQKQFGTKVALSNFLVNLIYSLVKDIGVQGIKLRYSVHRSAVTGRFISKERAEKNKDTTVRETIKRR